MSFSTSAFLLLGLFFIGLLHGSGAVLVDTNVANDWTIQPTLRGTRTFVQTNPYVIYQSTDSGLPLRATQHNSAAACISGSCPTFVLANNTENDVLIASDNNVYCRSKGDGTLFRVSQTGTNRVAYPGSTVGTGNGNAGQFFFVSNGGSSGVLYKQSNGEIDYVFASNGSAIDTASTTMNAAYPTGATARNPIATRTLPSAGVDLYWVKSNNLYYQLIGSGVGGIVNITTSISSIGNFRPFTSNGRYYLVQTTDSSATNSLWLVDPVDISAPILVSTGLNNVSTDQYVITGLNNIIVFLGQASSGDPYTLYRFRTATLDSAPTQIASASVTDGSNLVVGTSGGDSVFVTSGTSLFIVNANTNTVTGTITGVTSNAKYTTFGTSLLVVLSDTTGGTLRVFDYSGNILGSQVASNAVDFVAGSTGTNLLYTVTASGSQGLYRAVNPFSAASTRLTPSTLSTTDAAAMSYIIHNTPSRALFYIPSSQSLYSVPLAGCTYLTDIATPTPPSVSASCPGASVTLTTSPTPSGASNPVYQWQINSGSWTNVAGATSASFSPVVGSTATQYRVLASADCLDGNFFLTKSVTVTPTGNGNITVQPSFTSPVCPSATQVSLSVTTTGPSTPTYQWKKDGAAIAGANASTYAFARTNANSGAYTCDIAWPCNSRTTNSLTVTINRNTAISTHPANATVCANLNTHTFSVAAVGTTLTYQWYKGGSLISGATNATYTVSNLAALVDISTNYYVIVTGACGVVQSQTAYLEVLPGSVPSITYQPISKTVCPGADVRFHVEATGVALSYAWYFGPTLLNEQSANLNISKVNSTFAGDYRCEVKTSICTVQPSQIVSLTVADSCGNLTSVIFYIGAQTLASWNSTYRDNVFLPGIVGLLSDLGFTYAQSDILIISVKEGSVIVEFSVIGGDSAAALQALLDIWNLELTALLPKNGLTTVTDIKAGSAVVIVPTTSGSSSGGDGGSDNTGAIVGGVVGGVLGFAVLCICIVLVVLLVVFLVKALKGGGFKVGTGKKWKQQNWWEEDDL